MTSYTSQGSEASEVILMIGNWWCWVGMRPPREQYERSSNQGGLVLT